MLGPPVVKAMFLIYSYSEENGLKSLSLKTVLNSMIFDAFISFKLDYGLAFFLNDASA